MTDKKANQAEEASSSANLGNPFTMSSLPKLGDKDALKNFMAQGESKSMFSQDLGGLGMKTFNFNL